jgi:MFS family permease
MYYSTSIFKNAGLEGSWPIYATILIGVVQVVMTLVCTFIIEKAGRKILIIIGLIGMSVSSFVLAISRIYSVLKKNSSIFEIVLLIFF